MEIYCIIDEHCYDVVQGPVLDIISSHVKELQRKLELKLEAEDFKDDMLKVLKSELLKAHDTCEYLTYFSYDEDFGLMLPLEEINLIIESNLPVFGIYFGKMNLSSSRFYLAMKKKSSKLGEFLRDNKENIVQLVPENSDNSLDYFKRCKYISKTIEERLTSEACVEELQKYAKYIFYKLSVERYNLLLDADDINYITRATPKIHDTQKVIILNELGVLHRIKELNNYQDYSQVGYHVARLLNIDKYNAASIVRNIMQNTSSKNNPIKSNAEFIKAVRALLN